MTRATQTLALAVASAAVYAMLLTGIVPTSPKFQDEILPVIPWWVLVLFGAYALGTLGFDLLTINDKPEKYKELLDQIQQAKTALRAEGVDIDSEDD